MSEPTANNDGGNKPNDDKPNPPSNSDWRDKEITDLRDENARRRIEARDANAELERYKGDSTKAQDEKAEAVKRADTAETSLTKLRVALSVGVPSDQADEFAQLLQGNDEKELTEYANRIRKFNQTPTPQNDRAYDHSQGQGDGSPARSNSPAADFAEMFGNLPMFSNSK